MSAATEILTEQGISTIRRS